MYPEDGFRNTLVHRQRIMRIMFGTVDPDIRTLNDQGKIWYDELTRMIGSDNKEAIQILAKKGGQDRTQRVRDPHPQWRLLRGRLARKGA